MTSYQTKHQKRHHLRQHHLTDPIEVKRSYNNTKATARKEISAAHFIQKLVIFSQNAFESRKSALPDFRALL